MIIRLYQKSLNFPAVQRHRASIIKFNSKHHGKCKSARKLIKLATVSNLFPLEVVYLCQLCVLWEKAIGLSNVSLLEKVREWSAMLAAKRWADGVQKVNLSTAHRRQST